MPRRPLITVILAGGKGERFWPLSRSSRPKQFLRLLPGGKSLIEATAERLLPLSGWENMFVATAERLVPLIREHLPNLPPENLIVEPEPRDTAPAVAWVALQVARRFGEDAVFGLFPADHYVESAAAFQEAVEAADDFASRREAIVTLGITPSYPATGFGYIERGPEVEPGVHRVERFVEKPDRETAERYLALGKFFWNAGIFIARPRVLLKEFSLHAPEILGPLQTEGLTAYARLPKTSFDYAVMERTDKAYVIPARFGWDDLGDWTALERLLRENGKNVELARHVGLDTEGAIIYATSDDEIIVTLGVRDVVIVRDGEVTLVVAKDRVQEIKRLLPILKRQSFDQLL